jgi:hypothetical protein
MSPNEKYYRLMAGQKQDDCLTRAAIKNLYMYRSGISEDLLSQFKAPPPHIPQEIFDWFDKNYPAGR